MNKTVTRRSVAKLPQAKRGSITCKSVTANGKHGPAQPLQISNSNKHQLERSCEGHLEPCSIALSVFIFGNEHSASWVQAFF